MKLACIKPRIDYEFKANILTNHKDLLQYVNKCKRFDYCNNILEEQGLVLKLPNSDKKLMTINELRNECFDNGNYREFRECLKILKANHYRVKRLENRINAIISQNDSVFLTLTFSDTALSNTTAQTRRKAVQRFLKSCNAPYVANIDFGIDKTKTMREHYHAVIGCCDIDYKKWRDTYGLIKGERIIIKNNKALAKYVSKLTNHAIKEQARRSSLLYSRIA